MPATILQKLRIKDGMSLLTMHAPADFQHCLQPLPGNIAVSEKTESYDQLHWFVSNKAQLDKEVNKVMKLLKNGATCWCYYPKGTSKMQTDLTRDKGWESLQQQDIQWLSLISFSDIWSTFAFRLKTHADRAKDEKPKEREIFQYIVTAAKTVRLPDDMAVALQENKIEADFFQKLSFSNRKEYVEWVITAKREATRRQRVGGTIERLRKQWKNPNNT